MIPRLSALAVLVAGVKSLWHPRGILAVQVGALFWGEQRLRCWGDDNSPPRGECPEGVSPSGRFFGDFLIGEKVTRGGGAERPLTGRSAEDGASAPPRIVKKGLGDRRPAMGFGAAPLEKTAVSQKVSIEKETKKKGESPCKWNCKQSRNR